MFSGARLLMCVQRSSAPSSAAQFFGFLYECPLVLKSSADDCLTPVGAQTVQDLFVVWQGHIICDFDF
jgi:hypothetical protein